MSEFLLLACIFLGAGIIAVPIASRIGLGSVLGYLIAGVLIAPILAWLHVDVVSIQHFAEFGVVMMLFLVGLELEPKKLWEMRSRLTFLGGGQVVITAAGITIVAMLFGLTLKMSIAIGLIFALSSTAIVLQTLQEKGLLGSDGGQGAFSVLLLQDIAVIPMLALLPLLASPELVQVTEQMADSAAANGGHELGLSLVDNLAIWQKTLAIMVAVSFVVVGGHYLAQPLFRYIAKANLRELFTAAALFLVIGIALLMMLVGLSPALGVFLAGVVLATSEYRHELEADIEPFKGLLLGLFFITVGANINFNLLADKMLVIAVFTMGLVGLKMLVLFLLGGYFGIHNSDRWLFTISLAQAGEFGFVLLTFAVMNHVLPEALVDMLLLIVTLSMVLTPLLFVVYDRFIAPRYSQNQKRDPDHINDHNEIIIAGRGRVGGIVDRLFEVCGYRTTVIDYSSRQLEILGKYGVTTTYFGDATRPDLLRSAGIEHAKLLIVTIDDKSEITELVRYATTHYPDLHVIARAVDRDHVYDLWATGCRDIIRETFDSSLRIGRSALEALGVERNVADQIKDKFEEFDRKAMRTVAESYDPEITAHENEKYLEHVRHTRSTIEPSLRLEIAQLLKHDIK